MSDDAVRYMALALLACYPDASDPRWSLVRELAGVEDEGEVIAPRRVAYHDGDAWRVQVRRLYGLVAQVTQVQAARDRLVRASCLERGVCGLHELDAGEVRELADEIAGLARGEAHDRVRRYVERSRAVRADWEDGAWRDAWQQIMRHVERVGLDADEARAALYGDDPWHLAQWTLHDVQGALARAQSWDEGSARAWLEATVARQRAGVALVSGVFAEAEVRRG